MNKTLEKKAPSDTTKKNSNISNSIDSVPIPQNLGNQPTVFTSFAGPIPPPNFLEQYEKLVPGTAKRFLEEPHLESEHRRSIERLLVNEQVNLTKKGQWMAFSLAAFCVIAAFTSIFLGYDIAGLAALFISIAAFVGVFFYAKNQNK